MTRLARPSDFVPQIRVRIRESNLFFRTPGSGGRDRGPGLGDPDPAGFVLQSGLELLKTPFRGVVSTGSYPRGLPVTCYTIGFGGNDLSAGKTPEQIRAAARVFISKVHAALPETRIYFIGVPPVRRASTTPEGLNSIRALNALLADLGRTEKNVEFIDLFPAFLDDKGQHRGDLFVEDGTHFNAKG